MKAELRISHPATADQVHAAPSILIGIVSNKSSPVLANEKHTWESLARKITTHTITKSKDAEGWLPGPIEPGDRIASRMPCWHVLVLDVEGNKEELKGDELKNAPDGVTKRRTGDPAPVVETVANAIKHLGWACAIATSYSHEEPALVEDVVLTVGPRYRLTFPVSRPILPDEIKRLGVHIAWLLGLRDVLDTGCLSTGRFFYLPSTPPERSGMAQGEILTGAPLDVDALLQQQQEQVATDRAKDTTQQVKRVTAPEYVKMSEERQLEADLASALTFLNPDDYEEWVNVGIALSTVGEAGYRLWMDWGQQSSKFDTRESEKKWHGFKAEKTSYRAVFAKAQRAGWVNPAAVHRHMSEWQDADVSALLTSVDTGAEETIDPETGEILPAGAQVPNNEAKKAAVLFPPPFRGVMTDIVQNVLHAAPRPQPALAILGALIGMAASIPGNYSTNRGGRFNLYGMGTCESGGGKDLPRVSAETVAAKAGATILGRPGSGAGLEDTLQPRKNQLVAIDEIAHILKSANDERAAPHLRDMGAVLLKLFSASANSYNRRVLANTGARVAASIAATVPNPCLSLLGFATPEGLGDAFNESNFTDGLMGRMLFVVGETDVKPRRPGLGGFTVPQSVDAALKNFAPMGSMEFMAPVSNLGAIVVDEASGVPELLDQLLLKMEENRGDMSLVVARSLYRRSFEKLERIAGVLAVWDNPVNPVVYVEHVEWARAFVMASDAAMLSFVTSHMHSSETTKDAAKLRSIITRILSGTIKPQAGRPMEKKAVEAGCVARSHLLRVSKMPKNTFDRALAHMQDLGEMIAFTPKGESLSVLSNIHLDH